MQRAQRAGKDAAAFPARGSLGRHAAPPLIFHMPHPGRVGVTQCQRADVKAEKPDDDPEAKKQFGFKWHDVLLYPEWSNLLFPGIPIGLVIRNRGESVVLRSDGCGR